MERSVKCLVVIAIAITTLCGMPIAGTTDQMGDAGKQIAAKWQNAVVTVQLVIKMKYSYDGEESPADEEKSEVSGCVIDPTGLVVTPLSGTNPAEVYQSMVAPSDDYNVTTELSDVKILMADGTELPAKVILRDKDLDLAFIRPIEKPETAMTAFDLSKGAKAALCDPIIALSRQAVVGNRSITVGFHRIQSVLEKPRTFYVSDPLIGTGVPVFALDGGLVGITVIRTLAHGAGSSNYWENAIQVVLPASDILEAAKQAPATADGS